MRHTALALCLASAALVTSTADAQVVSASDSLKAMQLRSQATQAALRAQWAERVRRGQAPATQTEPSLTAGKVLTPTIDVTQAPGLPEIQLTINKGTVGLYNAQVSLTSPSGSHTLFAEVQVPAYPPAPGRLAIKTLLSSPFSNSVLGLYAEPGNWTITQIQISSQDGQFIFYNQTQVAALFSGPATVDVLNPGTPDATPPAARHGHIVTPTVSLSAAQPFAVAKLSATDDVSGVYSADVGFSAPGGYPNTFDVYATLDAPAPKATLTLSDLLPTSLEAGTYTITDYSVCDYAGNCTYDNTPAGIAAHFDETTINVTQ